MKKNCNLRILQLKTQTCVVSGFYPGINETSLFWDITRRTMVIINRRFGTTYRSSRVKQSRTAILKTESIGFPETSVNR